MKYFLILLLAIPIGFIAALMFQLARWGKKRAAQAGNAAANSGNAGPYGDMAYKTDMNELLRDSRQKISRLEYFARKAEDEQFARQLQKICGVASEILRKTEQKPDGVQDVRYFLNYYIPALIRIVESYDGISGTTATIAATATTADAMSDAGATSAPDMKKRMEVLIGDALNAFQKQLNAMNGEQLIDIEAEIQVFQNSLREDGLIVEDAERKMDRDVSRI